MTVWKKYRVVNEDVINVVYIVEAELDIGDGDKSLIDIIEHPITSEDDLAKIPQFEEEAKKREEELYNKAMRLRKIASKLEEMGYVTANTHVDDETGELYYDIDD